MEKKSWMIVDTVIIMICAVLLFGKMVQMIPQNKGNNKDTGSSESQNAEESTIISTENYQQVTVEQQADNTILYEYTYPMENIVRGENVVLGGNENLYEFYIADATWEDAYWKCMELGGHLMRKKIMLLFWKQLQPVDMTT